MRRNYQSQSQSQLQSQSQTQEISQSQSQSLSGSSTQSEAGGGQNEQQNDISQSQSQSTQFNSFNSQQMGEFIDAFSRQYLVGSCERWFVFVNEGNTCPEFVFPEFIKELQDKYHGKTLNYPEAC